MLTPVPPSECERARASVSAQLDGELSELETLRLELHLRDCAACASWASGVHVATMQLRQAPLEVPSVRIALPRRRRTGVLALAGASAAMAAAAAIAVLGSLGPASQGRVSATAAGERVTSDVPPLTFNRQMLSDGQLSALETEFLGTGTLRSGNVYAT